MRILTAVGLVCVFLISGCGGSGTSLQTGSPAKIAFAIEWPEQSRFIHQSADRIRISAKVNGLSIALPDAVPDSDADPQTVTLNKPDTTVTLPSLPSGPVTFTVESYSSSPLSPTLGKAVVTQVLVPGNNPNLEFVLESQSATVEVTASPAKSIYRVGDVLTLNARSRQADGAILIEGSGEFTFSVSNPSHLEFFNGNQVRVLTEGASNITARELGNDANGKQGAASFTSNEFDGSEWSLTSTGLPVSNSGIPLFTPNPVFKGSISYFAYGTGLLGVDSTGSWIQYPITGLEPDVTRIELIGVGPMEELYVRGYVQTGAFTFSVRDIYKLSSGFVATRVTNSLDPVNQGTFCVTRNGIFGSRVPSFDNSFVTPYAGPIGDIRSWSFTGQNAKPVFQMLDSGGVLIWNYDNNLSIVDSKFIANFAHGTNNVAQTIVPPPGYDRVWIATMNQEGFWTGTARSAVGEAPVFGRNGAVSFTASGEGSISNSAYSNSDGVTPFLKYTSGTPSFWSIYNPETGSAYQLSLGSTDLMALGIHTVINGGVMLASYQGKVAILKRTN